MNAIDHNNSDKQNCYYIDGPGGTGKTFIYNTLSYLVREKNKSVGSMASTGIAATLLPGGKTVHKTFGLPVPLFSNSTSNIKAQSKQGQYLKNIDIFIWDFMNDDKPFGGKIFVLGGDFRQLLPIKLHGTRSETVNLSLKNSFLWKCFSKYSLKKNMRARSDEIEFAKFLLDVGNGTLNDTEDNLQVPECCLASENDDIVEETYGQFIKDKKFKRASKCVILSARNADVDKINSRVISRDAAAARRQVLKEKRSARAAVLLYTVK